METDRSRIITYQRCPRERFYAYHWNGTGLQRIRKSLPLQFGSAFHEGSEELLLEKGVESAVERAQEFLTNQFSTHAIGFDGETPVDVEAALVYGREEQMALAEALLRGWWVYEGQAFLENFEVIEVEREGRAGLSHDLVLMFRPDALVRDRQSGDLYVVSWKTCATFGPRNIAQARHDMQSMSEVFGVEASRTLPVDAPFKIEGVLYKWIVKGSRRKDNWDGLYKQSSHLIYGWKKLGNGGGDEAEWSWAFEYEKEDGSGSSRLGKGWKKVPIWRDYPGGVKAWIDDLSANRIFPRHVDALGAVFPQALPVERRVDEVESWRAQVIAQEIRIANFLDVVQDAEKMSEPFRAEAVKDTLDRHFPQHTHSCHSYSGCSFTPICWEGVAAEPGELYQIRTANHPEKGDSDE